jgi:hypothetical protein
VPRKSVGTARKQPAPQGFTPRAAATAQTQERKVKAAMSSEPSFPKDAAVGTPRQNETLDVAVTAKEAEEKAGKSKGPSRSFVRGAAVGVGSAALVAALLYANRSRRPDKGGADKGPTPGTEPRSDD